MDTLRVVLVVVLAALLLLSALAKLSHHPSVVGAYGRVGVPEERLNLLAAVLGAAACGLLLGLRWDWIGLAAAAGTAVYFLLAIAAHVRTGQLSGLVPPVLLELLALAVLAASLP